MGSGKKNELICGHKDRVQNSLWKTIELLGELALWISLQVPMIEDGNNFGVEVQGYAIKRLQDAKKELKTLADGLKDYHSQRATAMKDICEKESTSMKVTEGENETISKGGEKDGNTTKKSQDKDKTVTTSSDRALEDAIELVVATDVHWFFHLRTVASQAAEVLQLAADNIEKNKGKILKPKGSRPMY